MSYPLMKPFLRGIYLTLNAWRPQRDEHGWKMSNKIFSTFMANMRCNGVYADVATSEDQDAPTMVKAVPVLYQHLTALFCLFEASDLLLGSFVAHPSWRYVIFLVTHLERDLVLPGGRRERREHPRMRRSQTMVALPTDLGCGVRKGWTQARIIES